MRLIISPKRFSSPGMFIVSAVSVRPCVSACSNPRCATRAILPGLWRLPIRKYGENGVQPKSWFPTFKGRLPNSRCQIGISTHQPPNSDLPHLNFNLPHLNSRLPCLWSDRQQWERPIRELISLRNFAPRFSYISPASSTMLRKYTSRYLM